MIIKVRNTLKLNIVFYDEIKKKNAWFIKDTIARTIRNFYLLGSEKIQEDKPSRKVDPFKIEIIMQKAIFTLNLYDASIEYDYIMEMVDSFLKNILKHSENETKGNVVTCENFNKKLIAQYVTFR